MEFYIWRAVNVQIWLFSTPISHVYNYFTWHLFQIFIYFYLTDNESSIYLLS